MRLPWWFQATLCLLILTAEDLVFDALRAGLRRERADTVSQWADRSRILSSVASAEPGQWRTSRTPYLREIMDSLSSATSVQRVVFMAGAQIGKTECGNNWIGYVIDSAPGPMLMVQPTVDTAGRVSKQRIAPMIEATPALAARVRDPRSRDSGNTVYLKEFDGGVLIMTGANSAAGLRSMPIRYLFMDEVDEYPGDLEGQGDPVMLAEKRTTTFPRRKILLTSTPTIKGASRIETEYLLTDRRRYFLACPACGHRDFLTWTGHDYLGATTGNHHWIEWDEGKPETARMVCSGCAARIPERKKTEMLAAGVWIATNPGGRPVGYHISALYSPLGWKSWEECVREFLDSKNDVNKRKTWVNTVLGETWEEIGTSIEPAVLMTRLENYEADVPARVGVLVASVDVQGDRLECAVKGYGAGEESWLIAFQQFHGDPGQQAVWYDLGAFIRQPFERAPMVKQFIECVAIDAQHHSEEVYRFCAARRTSRVYAVRGGSVRGQPVVGRPTTNNRYRVPLFTLGTDTAKDLIYSRLAIRAPGPGYVHLPSWVDLEYVEQLTAERAVKKWYKHRGTLVDWVKIRDRNEALDLEVYALAALHILGQPFVARLGARAASFERPVGEALEEPPGPDPGVYTPREPGRLARLRPRRGWMGRLR